MPAATDREYSAGAHATPTEPEPRATYRMQLQPAFTFHDAARLVPYLAALGVSHVYTSPMLQPAGGSEHGYDVADPTRLNRKMGGEPGFRVFQAAMHGAGLALVADVVPNHMAVRDNAWFTDVLAHGARSTYFHFFDLGTEPEDGGAARRIIIPALAQPYGVELEAGRLTLAASEGRVEVAYGSDRFPIAVPSLGDLFREAGDSSACPPLSRLAEKVAGHRGSLRATLGLEAHLARLLREDADAARAFDAVLAAVNRDVSRLHVLLERQHYRLAWWRLARDEQAYRRFFDVNGLIGVRVEAPDVFERTHALLLRLVRRGQIQGLRIDHVDGLADPRGYLERLVAHAPKAWVVVEKILAIDEPLPGWPVAGTTGYESGAWTTMVMNAPEAEGPLTDFYERFSGLTDGFDTVAEDAVREVSAHWLAADVLGVAAILHRLCLADPTLRDYSARDCSSLVRELLAALPVYRTYVSAGTVSAGDAALIAAMLDRARERRPDLPLPLLAFVARLFAGTVPDGDDFVTRFQQLTPAIRAKAVEDTACFRYNRFIAISEVGADPGWFSTGVGEFHGAVQRWQRAGAHGMRSTSTHDSKRSEDVRARLTVLTEDVAGWIRAVERWSARASGWRVDGFPDRNFEYYFYQTLVGAWPLTRERALGHAQKAIREAKSFTNWLQPSPTYEDAVSRWIEACYGDRELMEDIERFVASLHPADWYKSLGQVLLKLTIPGVPDLYQGSELWLLALSDPDNRRPVDYEGRRRLLAALPEWRAADVLLRADEGVPKLWTIVRTLALRRRRAAALASAGPYAPIALSGPHAAHVVAFTRGDEVAVLVPTRTVDIDWHGTVARLPDGAWSGVLTDERWNGGDVSMADLFARFPVALLERVSS